MITVYSDNKEIPVNKVEFSDSAITFKLDELPETPRYITINVDPCTPVKDVREELTLIVSCIEYYYSQSTSEMKWDVNLNIPYTPYGRADRVFEKGNPDPLGGFTLYIDYYLHFDNIEVCDIHNPEVLVGTDIKNKPQLECFKQSLPHDYAEEYSYIVAPDKGAMDKARTIAEHLETDIIFASKERDVSTGRIIKTTLPEDIDLKGAKVLIPDDLCDHGGTFIYLAKALRERGVKEIHLYVTHLIGASGLSKMKNQIDKIFYYQLVGEYVSMEQIIRFNNGN